MPSPLPFPHRKLLTTSQSLPPPPSPSLNPSSTSSTTLHSDAVVIVGTLLCALTCLTGLALIARCGWLHSFSPSTPPNNNKGLSKKHLRSLPKLTFSSSSSSNPDLPLECPICLADFAEGDEVRVLPGCGHTFHVRCIDMWLSSHCSCPSCRQDIAVEATGACKVRGADAEIRAKEREDAGASGVLP